VVLLLLNERIMVRLTADLLIEGHVARDGLGPRRYLREKFDLVKPVLVQIIRQHFALAARLLIKHILAFGSKTIYFVEALYV
jgi:hypothetical protein